MLSTLSLRLAQRRPRLWVVGDVMLDRYLCGTVTRIAPEAPTPVLHVSDSFARPGGAANVAHTAAALGAEVAVGGIVGRDDAARELESHLRADGVDVGGLLHVRDGVTTVKQRALAGGQQLLRVDTERRRACSVTETHTLAARLARALPDPDAVIVSDYDKGVVSPALLAALRARAPSATLFVDPKSPDLARYRGADVLTPNEREAALASGVEPRDGESLLAAALRLQAALPGTRIVLTRGAQGMALLDDDRALMCSPSHAGRVLDVTGAGDVAVAALAIARVCALDWSDALRAANVAAGLFVGTLGSNRISGAAWMSALSGDPLGLKLADRARLADLRRSATAAGKRIALANGCFDLLHAGHLRLLQTARTMADLLVVAINSDASVRRLKGADRPVVGERDRAMLLAGLESTDFVTIFGEDTPHETLRALRPDVLVKGGDYGVERIVGADEVRSWGGVVSTVPFVIGHSTTSLIREIVDTARSSHG